MKSVMIELPTIEAVRFASEAASMRMHLSTGRRIAAWADLGAALQTGNDLVPQTNRIAGLTATTSIVLPFDPGRPAANSVAFQTNSGIRIPVRHVPEESLLVLHVILPEDDDDMLKRILCTVVIESRFPQANACLDRNDRNSIEEAKTLLELLMDQQ